MSIFPRSSTSSPSSKGFTLVEMMVVVGIFLVITTILLGNLPSFRDHQSLDLVAQEISTIFREVQVFALGVKTTNTIYSHHGFRIETSPTQRIILFADVNATDRYEAATDIIEEVFTIPSGVRISRICVNNTYNNISQCLPATPATSVDAVFQIPLTEPAIFANGIPWTFMYIELTKPSLSVTNVVTLNQLGQVTIVKR